MSRRETKEDEKKVRTVLLVDDDVDFAQRVDSTLRGDNGGNYSLIWRRTGNEAIDELQQNPGIQIILLEYFLPDQTGIDVVRKISDLKIHRPVIVLSANRDFEIAVECMKCGVRDYILKNELCFDDLLVVISRAYEDYQRRDEAIALEITKHRIAAMREVIAKVIAEIEQPIAEMQKLISQLNTVTENQPYRRFISILAENVNRIYQRVEKLRTLNTDRTVRYIKDIRMIDLS